MKKLLLILIAICTRNLYAQNYSTIILEGNQINHYFEITSNSHTIYARYDKSKTYKVELKFEKGTIAPFLINQNTTARIAGAVATDSIAIFKKKLYKGDKLEIIVTEPATANYKEIFTFEIAPAGVWKTTFGASAVFPILNKENSYFVKTTGVANEYQITKGENPNTTYFVPSIFYNFIPNEKESSKFTFSGTGGIGIQTNNGSAAYFIGGSIIYYQNLGLSFGLSYHQMNILKTQYSDGQKINQNLSTEDIIQKAYRFNPFISLTYRFDKSPF